jgi:hypothetical protein
VADHIEFGDGSWFRERTDARPRAGVRPADQPVPEQRLWREIGAERIRLVRQVLSLVAGYRVVTVPVSMTLLLTSEAK